MAKQRFNLNETMLDARQGIEEARANAEKAGEGSELNQSTEESEAEQAQTASPQPEHTPDEIALQSIPAPDHEAEVDSAPDQETAHDKAEKSESPSVEKKISSIRKRIRKDEREERIMRNVYLDDDMLEKLEGIKKRMNRGRNKEKKDAFVSVIDLLNVAAQEFLDKYYTDIVGK